MKPFATIGKDVPRTDAREKATGAAAYTDDMKLPGMLYGRLLRSPLPHARIVNIDTRRAARLPGVKTAGRLLTYPATQDLSRSEKQSGNLAAKPAERIIPRRVSSRPENKGVRPAH